MPENCELNGQRCESTVRQGTQLVRKHDLTQTVSRRPLCAKHYTSTKICICVSTLQRDDPFLLSTQLSIANMQTPF